MANILSLLWLILVLTIHAILYTESLSVLMQSGSSICSKAKDRGDAHSCSSPRAGTRFYFDQTSRHCQPFYYDGCAGNENRFSNVAECRKKCAALENQRGVAELHGPDQPTNLLPAIPKCDGGVRAAIGPNGNAIDCGGNGKKCPKGYSCTSTKICCPHSKAIACDVRSDSGKYVRVDSASRRFFYNKQMQNCFIFTYFGSFGNANNFETYNECIRYCKGTDKNRRNN